MQPAFLALSTGVPAPRYSQQEILDYYLERLPNGSRARAIRAIFERAGVAYRHSVLDRDYFLQQRSTQERNERYMAEAVPLGEKVIRDGLEKAGYRPQDIDDLIVVSCTGFAIPGLDLHLAARLGMRPSLERTCVLGMGCYGAFPGMRRAWQAVSAQPNRLALVLALELCTLHFQIDGSSEHVVSTALFADGAGMALIGHSNGHGTELPRLLDFATYCDYQTFEHMSFTITDSGFRMYLSSYVPDLLAAQIGGFVDTLLQKNGLERDAIRFWGIHPGSGKIVDYVQEQLEAEPGQVIFAHDVLHNYGNMSSATILFVLDRIQQCGYPHPGDYGVLLAFGPGLTMEGLLVQW